MSSFDFSVPKFPRESSGKEGHLPRRSTRILLGLASCPAPRACSVELRFGGGSGGEGIPIFCSSAVVTYAWCRKSVAADRPRVRWFRTAVCCWWCGCVKRDDLQNSDTNRVHSQAPLQCRLVRFQLALSLVYVADTLNAQALHIFNYHRLRHNCLYKVSMLYVHTINVSILWYFVSPTSSYKVLLSKQNWSWHVVLVRNIR